MMQSVGLCHEMTGTCYTCDWRVVVAYFVIALIHCPEYVFLYFYTAYVSSPDWLMVRKGEWVEKWEIY